MRTSLRRVAIVGRVRIPFFVGIGLASRRKTLVF